MHSVHSVSRSPNYGTCVKWPTIHLHLFEEKWLWRSVPAIWKVKDILLEIAKVMTVKTDIMWKPLESDALIRRENLCRIKKTFTHPKFDPRYAA